MIIKKEQRHLFRMPMAIIFLKFIITNDMTGRVKRAGGVGPDHQLGIAGHYTETIFGTAGGG